MGYSQRGVIYGLALCVVGCAATSNDIPADQTAHTHLRQAATPDGIQTDRYARAWGRNLQDLSKSFDSDDTPTPTAVLLRGKRRS